MSNKLEQLERKLEKNIGIKKHAGKVRKGFFSMATVIWQVFDCELCMKKVARSLGLTFNLVILRVILSTSGYEISCLVGQNEVFFGKLFVETLYLLNLG